MKSLLLIPVVIVLTGCLASSPIKTSFPDVPTKLMVAPAELKTVEPFVQSSVIKIDDVSPSGIPLSVVTKTITDNYKTCNEYKEQIFGLQDWISTQKKLNP
jgi:hypothetical protein